METAAKAESFSLYDRDMKSSRKAQLSEATIQNLLSQLQQAGGHVSCAQLRRELRARTGRAGGVRRVYRVWKASISETPPTDASPIETLQATVARLESELIVAHDRAALAEHRERSHQATWAREVDRLRQRLRGYEHLELRPERKAEQVLNLYRDLHAARERIFELETRLATGPDAKSAEAKNMEEGG